MPPRPAGRQAPATGPASYAPARSLVLIKVRPHRAREVTGVGREALAVIARRAVHFEVAGDGRPARVPGAGRPLVHVTGAEQDDLPGVGIRHVQRDARVIGRPQPAELGSPRRPPPPRPRSRSRRGAAAAGRAQLRAQTFERRHATPPPTAAMSPRHQRIRRKSSSCARLRQPEHAGDARWTASTSGAAARCRRAHPPSARTPRRRRGV